MSSLYDGLVRKATRVIPDYTEFMQGSGHTAPYARKMPRDKTLLEESGVLAKHSIDPIKDNVDAKMEAAVDAHLAKMRELHIYNWGPNGECLGFK